MLESIINFFSTTGSIIFWFIIILIPLVIIHEYGHYLMARLFRVRVVEFGVGLPPRAYHKVKKGVIWSLNYLPLGGFAKIYGDHDAIDEANENRKKLSREETVSKYKTDRVVEIIIGQEMEIFLKNNGLDYDAAWQEFEKKFKKVSFDITKLSDENKSKLKQLETLTEWEMDAQIDSKNTFYSKSYWKKVVILLGGVTFNFITAVVLLASLAGFSDLTRYYNSSEVDVVESFSQKFEKNITQKDGYLIPVSDGALFEAGLEEAVILKSINNISVEEIKTFDDFVKVVQSSNGQEIPLTYYTQEDKDNLKTIAVTPTFDESSNSYKIGAGYLHNFTFEATGFFNSIGLGYNQSVYFLDKNWEFLGVLVKSLMPGEDKEVLKEVRGPVGIGDFGSTAFENGGVKGIILLMALISIALALFNLLPIPALDGGRIVLLTVNQITKSRNKKIEGMIIGATFILLIGLQILITYNDINTIIKQ